MKGMVILQGDEEGKKIFIERIPDKNNIRILNNHMARMLVENYDSFPFAQNFVIAKNIDCETTKHLQDYYPFYIVKVFPYAYKIVNNYKDGKFVLGCKSDSFESDIDEVLRLVSV